MRTCEHCMKNFKTRVATARRPYRYDGVGLDNVYLTGVKVYVCECGEAAAIPRIVDLHAAIGCELPETARSLDRGGGSVPAQVGGTVGA